MIRYDGYYAHVQMVLAGHYLSSLLLKSSNKAVVPEPPRRNREGVYLALRPGNSLGYCAL